jgi:hypothetical protein
MRKTLQFEIRRREFLITLSAIAAAFSKYDSIITFAHAAPEDIDAFKTALQIERSADEIIGWIPTFPDRFRALAFALSRTADETSDMLSIARRIASGEEQLPVAGLLSRLRNTFAAAPQALDELRHFHGEIHQGFDSLIDPSAALALLVSSIAARTSSPKTQFEVYLSNLPLPNDMRRTTQLAVRGLLTPALLHEIGIVPPDPFGDQHSAIALTWHLPSNAQDLAREVLSIGFDPSHRKELDVVLARGLKSVLSEGRERFQSATRAIETGTSYETANRGVESVTSDINAISAIGTFVLGTVFNDRAAANRFATGMQVASFGLQMGLMISTGGVGCMTMAGSLASALSGLQSGGADSSAAFKEALSGISTQIENLRQEMHTRFDRLELLELQALTLLGEISQDLKKAELSLTNKLNKLQAQVAEFEHYIKVEDRKKILNSFSGKVHNAQGAIGNPADPSYGLQYKNDILFSFLDHAIDWAGDASFISDASSSISTAVQTCERLDLAVSHIGNAAKRLKLKHIPNIDRNPIEWARGVQAYIEANSCLNIETDAVRNRAKEAWNIGQTMRDSFAKLCTRENVNIAMQSYREASEALRTYLLNSIDRMSAGLKHRLLVGYPPEWPKLRSPLWLSQYKQQPQQPVSNRYYLLKGPHEPDGEYFYRWVLADVEQDPIYLGETTGVISLVKRSMKPLGWTTQTGEPDISYFTKVGEYVEYTIHDRHSKEIGQIEIADIDTVKFAPTLILQPNLKVSAYNFASLPLGKSPTGHPLVFSFWEQVLPIWKAIYSQFDDSVEILDWLKHLDEDPQHGSLQSFNEVAAAFALYITLVSWSITDRIDDPWLSGVSSQMLRSIEDVKTELSDIALGMSRTYSPYLDPLARYEGDFSYAKILDTEDEAVYKKIRASFPSNALNREVMRWKDQKVLLNYATLVNTVLSNHLMKTLTAAERIRNQLAPNGQAVPYIDRMMSKLTAFMVAKS